MHCCDDFGTFQDAPRRYQARLHAFYQLVLDRFPDLDSLAMPSWQKTTDRRGTSGGYPHVSAYALTLAGAERARDKIDKGWAFQWCAGSALSQTNCLLFCLRTSRYSLRSDLKRHH